jgi:Uma2 family endonuclease
MSTTLLESPPPHAPVDAVPAESQAPVATRGLIVIDDVSWELYEMLVQAVEEQHISITYDNGRMALMSPLPIHELVKAVTAFLIQLTALELDLPCRPFGSTTWKRKDLKKGLEPDDCFYFQHAEELGTRTDIDLNRDPAPDLAVEVDITHHPMDRPSIYAALGVNELWRFNGKDFVFLKRGLDGKYAPITRSEALPVITSEILNHYIGMLPTQGERKLKRLYRDWLRTLPEAR